MLAGMEDARYRQYELTLNPGDQLFVYTDGVTEATNAAQQLYGADRLIAALNKQPQAARFVPERDAGPGEGGHRRLCGQRAAVRRYHDAVL